MLKKISKKALFIFTVLIIGGFGGVFADRYFFPYLSTTRLFSKYDFLKKTASDVTVINKTEQVFVKEETSIKKISNGITSSLVNVIIYPEMDIKKSPFSAINTTGVIATSDGIIMLYYPGAGAEGSNHKFKVLTSNENNYDAEFLGADSFSNLAFLKINANNLPVVSFGDVDNVEPGEKIIAIGNNQKNYGNVYLGGLISKFDTEYNLAGKTVSSSEKMEGILKADFEANSAFAGGLAVDYAGRAIGILGSIEKNNQQDYFIIPSAKVKKVMERAIRKNLDKNPVLGIYYVPLSKTYALANGTGIEKGALIFSPSGQQGLAILAGSPAQKAGLRINDAIIAVNGAEINSTNTLSDLLYQYAKGDEIELTVLRDNKEMKIKVQMQ